MEYPLRKEEITSSESIYNPGWLSDDIYEVYTMGEPTKSPGIDIPLLIEIGADTQMLVTSRSVYTDLDFFGDVGGLTDALRIMFGILVAFISQGSYMNRLISLLFFYKTGGATTLSAVKPED